MESEPSFDYNTLHIDSILDKDTVVTWSGGPDSTGLIFLILENYSCRVYPIFINRNQTNYQYENEAVKHYSKIFSKNKKFQPLTEVRIISPPTEFRDFKDNMQYALRNSDIINQGVRLALHNKINSVLLATFDGENQHSDGSKEYLEAKTIEIREGTGNHDFIACSPFHFPTKFPYTKPELFKKCVEMKFDLSKTRSCYSSKSLHCGICSGCTNRHLAFTETCTDLTKYETPPKTNYENRVEKIS